VALRGGERRCLFPPEREEKKGSKKGKGGLPRRGLEWRKGVDFSYGEKGGKREENCVKKGARSPLFPSVGPRRRKILPLLLEENQRQGRRETLHRRGRKEGILLFLAEGGGKRTSYPSCLDGRRGGRGKSMILPPLQGVGEKKKGLKKD